MNASHHVQIQKNAAIPKAKINPRVAQWATGRTIRKNDMTTKLYFMVLGDR